jgi:hypothetical protein
MMEKDCISASGVTPLCDHGIESAAVCTVLMSKFADEDSVGDTAVPKSGSLLPTPLIEVEPVRAACVNLEILDVIVDVERL